MIEYNHLELSTLVDMLATQRTSYEKMLNICVNSVEEFAQCKEKMMLIYTAIRHKS